MKYLKALIITLAVGFVYFYFLLPPINVTSLAFWVFVIVLIITFGLSILPTNSIYVISNNNQFDVKFNNLGRSEKLIGFLLLFIVIGIALINLALSPLFLADAYSKRIFIDEESVFSEDIEPLDYNTLPVIDKASSARLGDRVMGQIPDLVSQFDVSNLYTQINYQGEIVRATPLEYSDIFKYFNNRKEGVAGYIVVNSVTGKADLVRLDEGMKYMNSAILNKKLDRKLRFSYPTKIFSNKYFELDDESNPYWVVPTIKYVGVNIRPDIEGVVILDPITGDSNYYDIADVPEWVDHAYPSDLIIEKTNDWGRYKNGFWNSIFGQRNVTKTTRGYNYTIINDDVYLYTGITSVTGDESNLGFILSNLRTRDTRFYSAPGAEEYSARASAEGQVQHMNYVSTFPLLVNINNRPTYFLSLKDRAGLVKMYGLIDVTNYQRVVVTDSAEGIQKAIQNYIGDELDELNIVTETITIREINQALIDGNSFYFITDENDQKYRVSIKVNQTELPFLKINNQIEIGFYDTDNKLIEILTLTR